MQHGGDEHASGASGAIVYDTTGQSYGGGGADGDIFSRSERNAATQLPVAEERRGDQRGDVVDLFCFGHDGG